MGLGDLIGVVKGEGKDHRGKRRGTGDGLFDDGAVPPVDAVKKSQSNGRGFVQDRDVLQVTHSQLLWRKSFSMTSSAMSS